MDKIREEFEAWINRQGYFWLADKDAYWESWKASRAALCVEIPTEGEAPSFGNYVVFDSDDVRAMLDDAGVRYK